LSKRGALVLIFVLTLGTLGLMVSGLPGKLLAIREIVVEGGERIPVNDLRRMIDIEVGDNLLLADEQGAERRLVGADDQDEPAGGEPGASVASAGDCDARRRVHR